MQSFFDAEKKLQHSIYQTYAQVCKSNSLVMATASGSVLRADFIENQKVYEILIAIQEGLSEYISYGIKMTLWA
jgi:hypothetical protein